MPPATQAPAPPGLALDQIHLRLFAARQTAIDSRSWTLRDTQDSFWRMYVNGADGAALEAAGPGGRERVELAAGEIYFVPAGVRFDASTRSRVEHFYVHLDVMGLPQAALQALFGRPVHVPADARLRAEAAALAAEVAGGAPPALLTQCRLKALVYSALAAYLAGLPAEPRERYEELVRAQAPVQPALHEIEARLAERLTNAELAQRCHLSEDYFIRLFRASVGLSPTRYIQARRVGRAAQRLLFSGESIEAIAAATGFGNRFYFTRVFTRHLGVGPASYRRRALI